jgi:hypothetical protein
MNLEIRSLHNVGRKVRDLYEKRFRVPLDDPQLRTMIDFDNTLRKLLAMQPVPAEFFDDELIIRVFPYEEHEEDEEDGVSLLGDFKYLVDVGRKCRDLEKRESDDPVVKAMIEFDDALRRLLKVYPVDGVVQFLDDEYLIRVKPIPEEDKNKT